MCAAGRQEHLTSDRAHIGGTPPRPVMPIEQHARQDWTSMATSVSLPVGHSRGVVLGLRWMGGSLWFPGRKNSHWMRCPSCGNRTWCAVGWQD